MKDPLKIAAEVDHESAVKRVRKVSSRRGCGFRPVEPRFWANVDKRGPDECWPWTGTNDNRFGYGCMYVHGVRKKATHVSWSLANGGLPFPEGKVACHACDNPPCVNPRHIWPGTLSENTLDAVRKGRSPGTTGHPSWRRKLTHCQRGHPFSGVNLMITKAGRKCRECDRASKRRHDAKRRGRSQTGGKS